MKKNEVIELQYITNITNVPSILISGILSHNLVLAKSIVHNSISMIEVQSKRKNKVIPNGRPLHDYANLYFCARNPMLFKRKSLHNELCVLRINTNVLDIEGAVISTGNAASEYVAFYPSDRLEMLDAALIFAEYWTDEDPYVKMKKSVSKCAELLIPDVVPSHFILGAYISNKDAESHIKKLASTLETHVNPKLFFSK